MDNFNVKVSWNGFVVLRQTMELIKHLTNLNVNNIIFSNNLYCILSVINKTSVLYINKILHFPNIQLNEINKNTIVAVVDEKTMQVQHIDFFEVLKNLFGSYSSVVEYFLSTNIQIEERFDSDSKLNQLGDFKLYKNIFYKRVKNDKYSSLNGFYIDTDKENNYYLNNNYQMKNEIVDILNFLGTPSSKNFNIGQLVKIPLLKF